MMAPYSYSMSVLPSNRACSHGMTRRHPLTRLPNEIAYMIAEHLEVEDLASLVAAIRPPIDSQDPRSPPHDATYRGPFDYRMYTHERDRVDQNKTTNNHEEMDIDGPADNDQAARKSLSYRAFTNALAKPTEHREALLQVVRRARDAGMRRDAALEAAIRSGHMVMIRELLLNLPPAGDSSDRVMQRDGSLLTVAAQHGELSVLQTLLDSEYFAILTRPSEEVEQTPLEAACERGDRDIIKLLLATGQTELTLGNTDDRDRLIEQAIRGGTTNDTVGCLLDIARAAPGTDEQFTESLRGAFTTALEMQRTDLVSQLIADAQFKPDNMHLEYALLYGCVETTSYLLHSGHINPNAVQESSGRTVLMQAMGTTRSSPELVALLAEYVDIQGSLPAQDRHGITALGLAVRAAPLDAIEALLDIVGVDKLFEPYGGTGESPIEEAVSANRKDLIDMLWARHQILFFTQHDFMFARQQHPHWNDLIGRFFAI